MKPLHILGLIIFFIGAALLFGSGVLEFIREFFQDDDISPVIKWGTAAVFGGIAILLVSVIIERKKDKKEEQL